MRLFLVALGTIWFLLSTAVSYRIFTAGRPARPAIIVQPGALRAPQQQAQPLTPVEPEARPSELSAPAVEADVPEEPPPAFSEPEPEPVVPPAEALRPAPVIQPPPPVTYPALAPVQAVREPARIEPRESVSGARETRRPRPRKPKPAPAPTAPVESPAEPVARCMVCGEEAQSWVELEGQRVGYCALHSGSPSGPSAAGKNEKGNESGQSSTEKAGEGASAQCRGRTKSGSRCRRKTKDTSGLCYQHRR